MWHVTLNTFKHADAAGSKTGKKEEKKERKSKNSEYLPQEEAVEIHIFGKIEEEKNNQSTHNSIHIICLCDTIFLFKKMFLVLWMCLFKMAYPQALNEQRNSGPNKLMQEEVDFKYVSYCKVGRIKQTTKKLFSNMENNDKMGTLIFLSWMKAI